MPPVPRGYPFDLTDDELRTTLSSMMDPGSWPGFDDFGRLLPELKLELLRAGIEERSRRERLSSDVKALRVAYAALVVSAATLLASIVIAFVS